MYNYAGRRVGTAALWHHRDRATLRVRWVVADVTLIMASPFISRFPTTQQNGPPPLSSTPSRPSIARRINFSWISSKIIWASLDIKQIIPFSVTKIRQRRVRPIPLCVMPQTFLDVRRIQDRSSPSSLPEAGSWGDMVGLANVSGFSECQICAQFRFHYRLVISISAVVFTKDDVVGPLKFSGYDRRQASGSYRFVPSLSGPALAELPHFFFNLKRSTVNKKPLSVQVTLRLTREWFIPSANIRRK